MKKWGVLLPIFVILTVLLVTGCGAANQSTGLSDSRAISSEMVDRGAAIGDSGHSQTNEATVGQAGTDSTQSAAASAQPSGSDAASVSQQAAAQSSSPAKHAVTISINCQNAVDKGLAKQEKFQGVVPADGVILPPTAVEITDGETVFDVLKQVTRNRKIQMEYKGSRGTAYIQGINGLYEFDGGPLSGWMYFVNKQPASYSCGEDKVKNGDVIEWEYTCNLGKDLGQDSLSSNKKGINIG